MSRIPGEYIEKGIAKLRQGTPYGVAAIFAGEVSENDLDGARWRFVVVGRRVAIVEGHAVGDLWRVAGHGGEHRRSRVRGRATGRQLRPRVARGGHGCRVAVAVVSGPFGGVDAAVDGRGCMGIDIGAIRAGAVTMELREPDSR